MSDGNEVYWRVSRGYPDGEPCVLCMQWFDELGYDTKRYLTEERFATEAEAEDFLAKITRDRQERDVLWHLSQMTNHAYAIGHSLSDRHLSTTDANNLLLILEKIREQEINHREAVADQGKWDG